jgi:flagellar biosynthesis protein FlhB
MINQLINQTVPILGWLVLVAVGLVIIAFCLAMVWRIFRNAWGAKMIAEAIKEHMKNHPEKWERFDKFDITGGSARKS